MKRLLFALMILATPALAVLPIASNVKTVDVSKVTGQFDSFDFKWIGYNSQSVTFYTTTGTNAFDLTGESVAFKLSAVTTQQVTYVSMSTSQSNITISGNSATMTIPYTNVPPNRQYQAELFAWDGVNTNSTRTLAQGHVTVFQSIYGNNDSMFKFPSDSNYVWFTQSALQAHTTAVGTNVHGLGTASLSASTAFATAAQGTKADTAIQPTNAIPTRGSLNGTNGVYWVNNSTNYWLLFP